MSETVNATNPSIDQTVKIFDRFYGYTASVPTNEYDTVLGFFKTVTSTDAEANNFAVTIFRISSITNISAMVLLQQLQSYDNVELTTTMAYYLNGVRSPSTLLGLNIATTPNYYTARNIRS